MPLPFPLARTAFWDLLPIQSAPFRLERFEEMTRRAGGAALVAELAEPRWAVAVELAPMALDEAARVVALIEAHGASRPLFASDPGYPGPLLDLAGAALGGASVTVRAIEPTRLQLQGLPGFYPLSVGDRLHVNLPNDGRGYHRLLEPAQAGGAGATDWVEIDPPPRAGTAAGQAVTLRRAVARMRVVPGSVRPGRQRRTLLEGVGFDAVEEG
jgi:hypothetical protein